MTIEIKVPTLGESVTEATVAKWLKQPGEAIERDEPVVELETDKVTLEVPAPAAGAAGAPPRERPPGGGQNWPGGRVSRNPRRGGGRTPPPPRRYRGRSRLFR